MKTCIIQITVLNKKDDAEKLLLEYWEKWVNSYHNPNPTPQQKAAITRAWNKFAKLAQETGNNPYELSKEFSQP